jgi:hypothetical protein
MDRIASVTVADDVLSFMTTILALKFQSMDKLTVFGLLAVTAMLVTYALEDQNRWFALAFALSCVLGSTYGFKARGRATMVEALARIKQHKELNDVRVAMYSADTHQKTMIEAKRLGAVDFLVKGTIGFDRLLALIGELAGEPE